MTLQIFNLLNLFLQQEDLDFRAPFVSMSMDDDFPLISPSNSVMWGPQEPAPKKTTPER